MAKRSLLFNFSFKTRYMPAELADLPDKQFSLQTRRRWELPDEFVLQLRQIAPVIPGYTYVVLYGYAPKPRLEPAAIMYHAQPPAGQLAQLTALRTRLMSLRN